MASEPESREGTRAAPGTPLYVHLPFCAAKCPYCDFFSVAAEGQDVDGLVEAVLAEAGMRGPRRPRSVFLGGGTPSLLSVAQVGRLLEGLDRVTGFRASAEEVTAECNPESLDRDKARALVDLGVDRLSIGFQSLDPASLGLLGRVHSVEQSFRAFEAAREAGVRRVNVDLMYALPDQGVEEWRRELERVVALRPEHVSAYNLTYEEGTPFRRWLEEGRLEQADEERELELGGVAGEVLGGSSYTRYEISNYSLNGEECRHNLNYWRNGPYAGIGPAAASKRGFERSGNPPSIRAWRARVEAGIDPREWSEEPQGAARLGETWWLGLRLAEGVDPTEARDRAGYALSPEELDPALAVAETLLGQGLLERSGQRLALSQRGLPLADAVAREFLRIGREARGSPPGRARAGVG